MWDPDRLDSKLVDSYLLRARQAWPHHLYTFQEEIALCYLSLKAYNIALTLEGIKFKLDELINLIKLLFDKFHVRIILFYIF